MNHFGIILVAITNNNNTLYWSHHDRNGWSTYKLGLTLNLLLIHFTVNTLFHIILHFYPSVLIFDFYLLWCVIVWLFFIDAFLIVSFMAPKFHRVSTVRRLKKLHKSTYVRAMKVITNLKKFIQIQTVKRGTKKLSTKKCMWALCTFVHHPFIPSQHFFK